MPDLLTERGIAGYRVESLIGRGGSGVVCRARDLALAVWVSVIGVVVTYRRADG